jgi:hypothetical protein
MLRGLALPPNNRVRSHITAAKPPLTALCNSRAPLAALERQESVRRVVVCKSVARTHAVPRGPVPTKTKRLTRSGA